MCDLRVASVVVLLVLLSGDVLSLTRQSDIVFQNNGYSNVLIAVEDRVRNDGSIVSKIQNAFKSASQFMYKSTRQRAYFKDIKIVVPATWYDPSYKMATTETLQNADIIIRSPTKRRRSPTTRSYAGCGHQGIHILMDTSFIYNTRSLPYYGYPEKYIIHEWAKFRWGVFEEYPSPGENSFYFSTLWGRPDAVKCTALLRGRQTFHYPNGTLSYCQFNVLDPITGLLPETCVYTPYPYGNRGTSASVMDHQYIREIVDFCDDFGQYKTQHNREPPNRQNRLCGHRSTWDVILNTTDFRGNRNQPRNVTAADIIPQFTVYRLPRSRRSVLILNSTTKDINLKQKLYQSAAHFIQMADIHHEVVLAHNSNQRSRTIRSAHDKKKAMRLLKMKMPINMSKVDIHDLIDQMFVGVDNEVEKHVVLLTDNDVTDIGRRSKQQSNIKVDVINLSAADDTMFNNTKFRTKGISYYFDHGHPKIGDHVNIVYDVIENSAPIETRIVQLFGRTEILQDGADYSNSFTFDDTLSGNILISLTTNSTTPIIRLTSPTGKTYDTSSREFEQIERFRIIKLEVEGEVGEWRFQVKSRTNYCKTIIKVLAKLNQNKKWPPVRLQAWTRMNYDEHPPRLTIFADVTRDRHPVVNLNVTAFVYKIWMPNSEAVILELFDNGAGADVTKNDGIYSRHFINFNGNGHYVIKIEAGNKIKPKLASENINRSTSGGSILIEHQSLRDQSWITHGDSAKQSDIYPPSRVFDLEVIHVSQPEMTFTISWTAPGDDLDNGVASRYDLRYSHSGAAMLDNPDKGIPVPDSSIISGNLYLPKPAGQPEFIKVNMTMLFLEQKRGFAFRLRAIDDKGNCGEFSNLATAGFS